MVEFKICCLGKGLFVQVTPGQYSIIRSYFSARRCLGYSSPLVKLLWVWYLIAAKLSLWPFFVCHLKFTREKWSVALERLVGLLVEWCFTPLLTVFQSYHGNSSHYSCLSWVGFGENSTVVRKPGNI